MPASRTAVELLNFGRLVWQSSQRSPSQPEDAQIKAEEDRLIGLLHAENSTTLRQILNYSNNGKSIEPVALRAFCVFAYMALCTSRLGITVAEVACWLGGDDAARVLEARRTVSNLLLRRQLVLRDEHSDCVCLGKPALAYFAGGSEAPPLMPTESDLRRAWYRTDRAKARREAKAEVPLSARQLSQRIGERVVGLEREIRVLSCRLAIHLRRAALIKDNKDPGIGNECLLFIGPSGAGKTFLAENAGKVSGLPFASISSGDITAQGYVGLDVSDSLQPLITATNGDPAKARFGALFLDEWDKKAAAQTNWRDIGGTSVQQEMLRLMEGTQVQIGGRRTAYEQRVFNFNTYGTMFIFGGAFVGLDQMIQKGDGPSIGFHDVRSGSSPSSALYDGLERFGMLPEFLNRLTGIVVFPEPTLAQVTAIITRSIVPSFNRVLAAFDASIEVSEEGIRLAADAAVHSKTHARGAKAVMASLIEDLVFNQDQGTIRLGIAEVRRAIESAGLGATVG
jgi:ATP-dependent Clp protease ATP-binding subunit ClpX